MTAGLFRYRVFGLELAAPFELATLRGAVTQADDGPADVEIRLLPVRHPAGDLSFLGMGCEPAADGLILDIPGAVRFRILDGATIDMDVAAGVSLEAASEYLLGTAVGAALHQRGYLPLHGNAVLAEGRAYAFMGPSGAGKSTLAAHFQARGLPLITDDLCAVQIDPDGAARIWPGIPRVKLWRDALEALAHDGVRRPLSWTAEKFETEATGAARGGPFPLAGLFVLQPAGESFAVQRLTGMDAVNALFANTYRRRLVDLLGRGRAYLDRILALSEGVPVWGVTRRWGHENLPAEVTAIEQLLSEHGRKLGAKCLYTPKATEGVGSLPDTALPEL